MKGRLHLDIVVREGVAILGILAAILVSTFAKIYLMRNSPMSRAFMMPSMTTSRLQEVSEHKRSKANLKPESPWNTVLKGLYVVRILKNESDQFDL